jgi:predicted RNA binding protein YcfA (HicA-like mRNA interferase family)
VVVDFGHQRRRLFCLVPCAAGLLHASKTLHPKVVKSIMRDAELTAEELERLL